MTASRKTSWEGAEMWPLARVKPYDKNTRTHPPDQVKMLANLLRKFGPDQPIVVDEDGVILKGHGRRLGALEAEMTEFPVYRRRGLSKHDKKALRISDNQVALLSGWDADLMRVELTDLKLADYDLDVLGFSDTDLARFMDSTPGQTDPDETPEPPAAPIVQPTDLWLLGRHRIMCGDCTSKDDVARLLGDDQPNLMVTDPPYGVNYDPNWRNEPEKLNVRSKSVMVKKTKAIGKVVNDHRDNWTEAWERFAGNVAYVWCGERQSVSMATQLESVGLKPRNLIVWGKTHHVISRGHYHPQHETCWYAVREGKTASWHGDRAQSTLWSIENLRQFGRTKDGDEKTGHGTQKPVECMRRGIANNSRPGDLVYEPFAGSGTTLIAAEMTGRRCLALEIDPAYCQVVIERWQKFTGLEATLKPAGAGEALSFKKVAAQRRKGGNGATRHSGKPIRSRKRPARPARAVVEPPVRAEVPAA